MKGKLQNAEDILTSNVFGLLKLVSDNTFGQIFNLLLSEDKKLPLDNFANYKLELWQRFDVKEPDVYLELTDGTKIIIEVKYGTQESSENQLKDYLKYSDAKFLIYLTSDRTEPTDITQKPEYKVLPIYWTNWYKVNDIISKIALQVDGVEKKILELIVAYLQYKDFVYFSGWSSFDLLKVKHLTFYKGEDK